MSSPQSPAWFVTGTDTDVGKTFVCCALLRALRNKGIKAIGMKPVAAGTNAAGRNDDVERLLAASAVLAPRALVNPYLFQPAIAPHIAAAQAGVVIDIAHIVAALAALRAMADAVLVEGVGGFCVPLGAREDSADLAARLDLPVILVVGMRLGCINHALLTQQAIGARRLKLCGWVANRSAADMPCFEENLTALEERLTAPLLGVIPANCTPEQAAMRLKFP